MAVNCDFNDGRRQVCGNECFDIVKSSQTYTVPCTKQVCEAYTVQVPKTKAITVNKQEPYIDYETRSKEVPYQWLDRRTITRSVPTCRTFPIIKNVCTSVRARRRGLLGRQCYVKKKCPRTVYVRKRVCTPRQFCQSIPRVGWKTVQESVPVRKFRTKTEVKYKTENVPERRYKTRNVTKMVQKTVPVYNVVVKPQRTGEQQDTLVQTIPAPDTPTVLPPLTIQTGPVITHSSVKTENSAAAYASVNVAEPKIDGGASFINYGVHHGGTRFIEQGLHQDYRDGEAVILNDNGIGENLDGKLGYANNTVYPDINEYKTYDINEYKTYDTLNAGISVDVANGKQVIGTTYANDWQKDGIKVY